MTVTATEAVAAAMTGAAGCERAPASGAVREGPVCRIPLAASVERGLAGVACRAACPLPELFVGGAMRWLVFLVASCRPVCEVPVVAPGEVPGSAAAIPCPVVRAAPRPMPTAPIRNHWTRGPAGRFERLRCLPRPDFLGLAAAIAGSPAPVSIESLRSKCRLSELTTGKILAGHQA